jgi:hypothetical protein
VCDPRQALAIGADELSQYRHAGNEVGVADIQLALGRIHMDGGQVDSARSSLTESMELWRRLGMSGNEWGGAGWACLELGHLEAMQGHPQSAAALYERSLQLHEEAHAMDGVAAACLGLGHACLERDQFLQAERWFKRSLCHFREVGMKWGVALALAGLYGATMQLGHEHTAAVYAGAASAILRPEELITLRPADRLPFEHMLASAQSHLSDAGFAAAWRTGRDMPLAQASALTLS